MNEEHRTAVRIAHLIRDQATAQESRRLATLASADRGISAAMTRYLDLCRRMAKAHSRQWLAAAGNLAGHAALALDDLHYEIEARRRQRQGETQPISTLGDILRDLRQVREEFNDWQFDEVEQTLCVLTDTIELEGICLGPFEIQLHLDDLGSSDPLNSFLVIAKEPNCACGRENVTHPHVNDDRLCAGDAVMPINNALRAGRICDFFILVRSVLQTYNSSSAYVRLEEWSGEACHDCGYVMDSESSYFCEFCEHNFCESCTGYCTKCETAACMGCMETCPECREGACPSCTKTCQECGKSCCEDCLTEGLCPTCLDEKENSHDPDEHDNVPVPAVAIPGQAA